MRVPDLRGSSLCNVIAYRLARPQCLPVSEHDCLLCVDGKADYLPLSLLLSAYSLHGRLPIDRPVIHNSRFSKRSARTIPNGMLELQTQELSAAPLTHALTSHTLRLICQTSDAVCGEAIAATVPQITHGPTVVKETTTVTPWKARCCSTRTRPRRLPLPVPAARARGTAG